MNDPGQNESGPWTHVPPERQDVCAFQDCPEPGEPQMCFYHGRRHHHGCIHYDGHDKRMREGWCLVCNGHYALLKAEEDLRVKTATEQTTGSKNMSLGHLTADELIDLIIRHREAAMKTPKGSATRRVHTRAIYKFSRALADRGPDKETVQLDDIWLQREIERQRRWNEETGS
jgi:hypothetical protein